MSPGRHRPIPWWRRKRTGIAAAVLTAVGLATVAVAVVLGGTFSVTAPEDYAKPTTSATPETTNEPNPTAVATRRPLPAPPMPTGVLVSPEREVITSQTISPATEGEPVTATCRPPTTPESPR